MSSEIKVLVCCHKKVPLPVDSENILLPIHVGAAVSEVDLGLQKDNLLNDADCDNISDMNGIYCELTAIYWAWKNIQKLYPDIQYVGLCHYRRYFYWKNNVIYSFCKRIQHKMVYLLKITLGMSHSWTIFTTEYNKSFSSDILNETNPKIKKNVYKYDILTSFPMKFYGTNIHDFFAVIGRSYIELMEKIVKEKFPGYYSVLENVLYGNKLCCANMFICKINLLDEYCSFIFTVLQEHLRQPLKT